MPFHSNGKTKYFYFPALHAAGMDHGFFTRTGGVSPAPWHSLNAGLTVGDEGERVQANIERAVRALGRDPAGIRTVRQVHGKAVVEAAVQNGSGQLTEADAILTEESGLTLSMRFADCVPIILFDPIRKAAAIAHAGWRGTVGKIAAGTVREMSDRYGSHPEEILAGIGPSICAAHYEVGRDVADRARAAFGNNTDEVLRPQGEKWLFDLWEANRIVLEEAGVRKVGISDLCTAGNTGDWFSHRAEHGRTGRFLALAGLRK